MSNCSLTRSGYLVLGFWSVFLRKLKIQVTTRNMSGESLSLYKIKSGPSEDKTEEKKNHCVRRDKFGIRKVSDPD